MVRTDLPNAVVNIDRLNQTDFNQRSRVFSALVNGGASAASAAAAVGIDVEVPAVSNTDGGGNGE